MATFEEIFEIAVGSRALDITNLMVEAFTETPLLSRLMISQGGERRGPNRTFQFTQDVITPEAGTLDLAYTAASGDITVTDSTLFLVGDQCVIDNHFDTNQVQQVFTITAIPDATSLTVTVKAGTDTTVALATPPQSIRIIRGQSDGTTFPTGDGVELPTLITSFFQHIQITQLLGRQLISEGKRGVVRGLDDSSDRSMVQHIRKLAWKIQDAVLYSVGTEETTSVLSSKMDGILTPIPRTIGSMLAALPPYRKNF